MIVGEDQAAGIGEDGSLEDFTRDHWYASEVAHTDDGQTGGLSQRVQEDGRRVFHHGLPDEAMKEVGRELRMLQGNGRELEPARANQLQLVDGHPHRETSSG
jgi:hypothetical protein